MNKSKQEKLYELRSIISCIQWWLNEYNNVPTEVGAFIQRHARIYLGFETNMCMDDLLAEARKQYNKIKEDLCCKPGILMGSPGNVIKWVPPHVPLFNFTDGYTRSFTMSRRDQLEAMSEGELDDIYRETLREEKRKAKIDYILEAERDY